MSDVRYYNLLCSRCFSPVGKIDSEELAACVGVNGVENLCFDCAPDGADAIPDFFEDLQDHEKVRIEDEFFTHYHKKLKHHYGVGWPSHAHAPTPAVCLSSYTYLNTSPNRDGARGTVNENYASRLDFDGVEVVLNEADLNPPPERSFSAFESDIILPAWIVKQPERAKPCLDCEKERLNYSNRYGEQRLVFCAYHHALLIEQAEDGSLGFGHA